MVRLQFSNTVQLKNVENMQKIIINYETSENELMNTILELGVT